MIFVSHYDSPLGILYLAADEEALKGVWFEGQKYFASGLKENGTEEKETPVLKRTREWLDPVSYTHLTLPTTPYV